jgi:AcrR family transcriptional regulator
MSPTRKQAENPANSAKPTSAGQRRRGRPPAHPDRHESILEAALEAFVERGFHGTAIPQIAERANIAAGTIYHYFESKEALVNVLYRSWKSNISKMVFAEFPQGAPVREQFRTMWNVMVTFARKNPTAFAFIELHNHASYLDQESIAIDRTIKEFTAGVIKRAQAEGLVKRLDAHVLMELVFGAFVGMLRASWEKRIVLDDDVIAGAEQACWDAIASHT